MHPGWICSCLLLLPILAGCAGTGQHDMPFMPSPAFLEGREVTPCTGTSRIALPGDLQVRYATLPEPATSRSKDRVCTTERTAVLRLAIAASR